LKYPIKTYLDVTQQGLSQHSVAIPKHLLPAPRKLSAHYLYFLQCELGGPIKVGETSSLANRLMNYRSESMLPGLRYISACQILHLNRQFAQNHARNLETDILIKFAGLVSHRREWLLPGDELCDYIESLPNSINPKRNREIRF
jgi:hypothetical protein